MMSDPIEPGSEPFHLVEAFRLLTQITERTAHNIEDLSFSRHQLVSVVRRLGEALNGDLHNRNEEARGRLLDVAKSHGLDIEIDER